MGKVVNGHITASDISVMGKLRYGYLGIETDNNEHLKVKITAFTEFDTLDVGASVKVELEAVGDEELLTAKKISNSV